MEHGDIIEHNNRCYIVLYTNQNEITCLSYELRVALFPEDECRKVGSADALFKALYELKDCERRCQDGQQR